MESVGSFSGGRNRFMNEEGCRDTCISDMSFFLFSFKSSRYFRILSHFLSNSSDDDIFLFAWDLYSRFKSFIAALWRRWRLSPGLRFSLPSEDAYTKKVSSDSSWQADINAICSALGRPWLRSEMHYNIKKATKRGAKIYQLRHHFQMGLQRPLLWKHRWTRRFFYYEIPTTSLRTAWCHQNDFAIRSVRDWIMQTRVAMAFSAR